MTKIYYFDRNIRRLKDSAGYHFVSNRYYLFFAEILEWDLKCNKTWKCGILNSTFIINEQRLYES